MAIVLSEDEAQRITSALNYRNDDLSEREVMDLYRRFGGVDVFSKTLPMYHTFLKGKIVGAFNFPTDEYESLLGAKKKLTRDDVQMFGHHPRALASFEIFQR